MPLARLSGVSANANRHSADGRSAEAQRGKSEQAAQRTRIVRKQDLANVSQPAKMSITGGIPFVPKKSPEKFGPYLMPQLPPEVSEEQKKMMESLFGL